MQDHLHSPTYDNILFDSTYTSLLPPPPHQTYTTKNRHFAECRRLYQVYFIGHSAKTVFAKCQIKYTRQKKNTRQNASLPSAFFLVLGKYVFCRVLFFGTRQNASLPSAFFLALGKYVFCRVPLFWHSAKRYFAVCIFFGPRQISFLNQFLRP